MLKMKACFAFSKKVLASHNLERSMKQKLANVPQRQDALKYSYLQGHERFEDLGDKLHADLQHSLRENNYEAMTEI